jgi:MarR family transcriptional regulator for hemolysin
MIRLLTKAWNYCDSVAFAAFSSSKAFEKALDVELRKRGNVTASQSRILGCLFFYKNGITQKEIADKLGIEAATLVPIIDRLEESGLVQRKPDPSDRRNNLIFSTARAQDAWTDIVDCASLVRRIAEKGIPSSELVATHKVLRTITHNLNEYLNSSLSASTENALLHPVTPGKKDTAARQRRGA